MSLHWSVCDKFQIVGRRQFIQTNRYVCLNLDHVEMCKTQHSGQTEKQDEMRLGKYIPMLTSILDFVSPSFEVLHVYYFLTCSRMAGKQCVREGRCMLLY